MLTSVASVFFVFGVLGGLLLLLRRWSGAPVRGRHIEVVETVPLAAGKSLSVVKVAGRVVLLGHGAEAVTLISELDPGEFERGPQQAAGAAPGRRRPSLRLAMPCRWIGRSSPAAP